MKRITLKQAGKMMKFGLKTEITPEAVMYRIKRIAKTDPNNSIKPKREVDPTGETQRRLLTITIAEAKRICETWRYTHVT